jgi:hypothetical protein
MAGFVLEQFFIGPVGLPMERSTWDFGRAMGHMGASDQVVSLEHLLLTSALVPGDHVLLCGGAAGFASSCVVLEIVEIPAWAAERSPTQPGCDHGQPPAPSSLEAGRQSWRAVSSTVRRAAR